MRRFSWKLGVVLLVSVGILGFAVWQIWLANAASQSKKNEHAQIAKETAKVADTYETARFDALTTRRNGEQVVPVQFPLESGGQIEREISAVEEVLLQVPAVSEASLDDQVLKNLVRTATEFVYFRFIRDDAEDYLSWRFHRGDRFREPELLFGTWQVAADYESYFEETFVDETPPREVFLRFFSYQRQQWGDRNTPVGLSVDPSAMMISTSLIDPTVGLEYVDLGSEEKNNFWYEPQLGSNRCWFDGGANLVRDNGEVRPFIMGTVGIVLEFADGTRKPILIGAFLTEDKRKWSIEYLWTNELNPSGGLIEF